MFNVGRNQKSILLIVLFTGWVLSPFIGFFLAHKISKHWTFPTRASHYWLMIILVIFSLVVYSGTFYTPKTKPASMFLIIPLISWLLLIITAIVTTPRQEVA
jgi:MFS family permease